MIAGLLGLIALWVDKIPRIVPIILDAIAAILFLVGGVLWAIWMSKRHCMGSHKDVGRPHDDNPFDQICDPLVYNPDDPNCSFTGNKAKVLLVSHVKNVCQTALANTMYHFLAFVTAITLLLLGLLAMKRMASLLGRSSAY